MLLCMEKPTLLCHLMRPLLSLHMRDGSRISFWTDKWMTDGAIITVVRDTFIKRMGMRQDISVRDFYLSETWINFTSGSED